MSDTQVSAHVQMVNALLWIAAGLLTILSIPVFAIFGLKKSDSKETYLVIRSNSFLYRQHQYIRSHLWADVTTVSHNIDGHSITIVVEGVPPVTIDHEFANTDLATLCKLLNRIRLRALLKVS